MLRVEYLFTFTLFESSSSSIYCGPQQMDFCSVQISIIIIIIIITIARLMETPELKDRVAASHFITANNCQRS